jgi:hypothetical protein
LPLLRCRCNLDRASALHNAIFGAFAVICCSDCAAVALIALPLHFLRCRQSRPRICTALHCARICAFAAICSTYCAAAAITLLLITDLSTPLLALLL